MYGREGGGREEEKRRKEREGSLKIAEKRTESGEKGGMGERGGEEREHTEENKRKDRAIKRRKQ